MTATLKSTFFAATLSLAIAFGMTTGQAIFYPDTAQAGVLGKIGGAVKGAAKGVGAAAKAGAKGTVYVGKTVGKGVGGDVKRAAVYVGKQAAKTPPVKGVINAVKAARAHAKRI